MSHNHPYLWLLSRRWLSVVGLIRVLTAVAVVLVSFALLHEQDRTAQAVEMAAQVRAQVSANSARIAELEQRNTQLEHVILGLGGTIPPPPPMTTVPRSTTTTGRRTTTTPRPSTTRPAPRLATTTTTTTVKPCVTTPTTKLNDTPCVTTP